MNVNLSGLAHRRSTQSCGPHSSGSSARRPETPSQARTWDRVKRVYTSYGLCGRCAAQAAWGHQVGFADLNPACSACVPVIADLPVSKPGGWRSLEGRVSDVKLTEADDVA